MQPRRGEDTKKNAVPFFRREEMPLRTREEPQKGQDVLSSSCFRAFVGTHYAAFLRLRSGTGVRTCRAR
jgi:hypothetical protein